MIQENFQKVECAKEKKEKRSVYVGAKVTTGQKEEICQMAKRCGMTVSDYLLSRACGYKPKERLNEEERAICTTFKDIRSDIRRFFAALDGISAQKRMYFLTNYSNLLQWCKYLEEIADKISDFLDKVLGRNSIPRGTRKHKEEQQNNV